MITTVAGNGANRFGDNGRGLDASLGTPESVAVDPAGFLHIADTAPLTVLSPVAYPLSLTIGGRASQVAFAGLAPGFTGCIRSTRPFPPVWPRAIACRW